MAQLLYDQWKARVLEAETEVSRVEKDIKDLQDKRTATKLASKEHAATIEREKKELLKELQLVEAEAKDLNELCEKTLTKKDRVEAVYISTLDEYENMHYLVRSIKDEEESLAAREDLETRLQRESLAWGEEEHGLRSKLNTLQQQLRQSRRQQQQEITDLETDLAALEKRLQQDRSDRVGATKQQARSAMRSSRQATPAPAGARAQERANSFVAANAGGAVPTRHTQLRSCLKAGNGSSSSSHTASAAPPPPPPPRAGSQPIVTAESSADVMIGGAKDAQPSLALMRAYSYGPGKRTSRKRDILGESTNHQD